MQNEVKEYSFFTLILILLLAVLLMQYKSKHVMTEVRTRQVTNMDVLECTRKALDKHHAELLNVRTISAQDNKYLRVNVRDNTNNTWQVDCDLISHGILYDDKITY
jgi:hypothetical protein